jgi:hypothetical protein
MDLQNASTGISEQRAAAWFAAADERLRALAERFPAISLNYSDSSLRCLLADASEMFALGPRTPGEELPLWYEDDHPFGYQALTTDSLWLVDALAGYEGDVIITRDPMRLRWGIHHTKIHGNGFFSQPAVVGYRWPFCTIEDIALFAVRAASGEPDVPQHVVAAINCYVSICQLRSWVDPAGARAPNS